MGMLPILTKQACRIAGNRPRSVIEITLSVFPKYGVDCACRRGDDEFRALDRSKCFRLRVTWVGQC